MSIVLPNPTVWVVVDPAGHLLSDAFMHHDDAQTWLITYHSNFPRNSFVLSVPVKGQLDAAYQVLSKENPE